MFTGPSIPIFNTFLLIVVSLAVGLGYLRWAKAQGATTTIKLLNEEINALKLQNARLDGDNRTLNGKFDEQSERIKLLTDLVHGVPAWDKLHESIAKIERNAARMDQLIEAYPTDWLQRMTLHVRQTQELYDRMQEEDRSDRDHARQAGERPPSRPPGRPGAQGESLDPGPRPED